MVRVENTLKWACRSHDKGSTAIMQLIPLCMLSESFDKEFGGVVHQSGKEWNDGQIVDEVNSLDGENGRLYRMMEAARGNIVIPFLLSLASILQGSWIDSRWQPYVHEGGCTSESKALVFRTTVTMSAVAYDKVAKRLRKYPYLGYLTLDINPDKRMMQEARSRVANDKRCVKGSYIHHFPRPPGRDWNRAGEGRFRDKQLVLKVRVKRANPTIIKVEHNHGLTNRRHGGKNSKGRRFARASAGATIANMRDKGWGRDLRPQAQPSDGNDDLLNQDQGEEPLTAPEAGVLDKLRNVTLYGAFLARTSMHSGPEAKAACDAQTEEEMAATLTMQAALRTMTKEDAKTARHSRMKVTFAKWKANADDERGTATGGAQGLFKSKLDTKRASLRRTNSCVTRAMVDGVAPMFSFTPTWFPLPPRPASPTHTSVDYIFCFTHSW
jgi:hypothetical protein